MKLIVDSGSTKAAWCLISSKADVVKNTTTDGVNPQLISDKELACILSTVKAALPPETSLDEIWFYGAGCVGDVCCKQLSHTISLALNCNRTYVMSDIVGAARALFGNDSGVACILGTGSGATYYTGSDVTRVNYTGGYILGDEGSGAALGKRLLADWTKRLMPADIYQQLTADYSLSYPSLVERIYRSAMPNRYLASFAPFLSANIGNEYVRQLVASEFDLFFTRMLCGVNHDVSIGFVGSVAHYFAPQLRSAAARAGYHIAKIIQNPIAVLAKYHSGVGLL